MTFIFSQPFKLYLARKCFFKKKIETHAAYLQKCELYKTSYSLFHERFSILQRVGWALDYDWLKCGELRNMLHETHTRRRHYNILLFSYTCPITSTELPFISCFQEKCFSSSLALAFLVESKIMPYAGDTLGYSLRRLRRSAHKVVKCVNSPFSQVKNWQKPSLSQYCKS